MKGKGWNFCWEQDTPELLWMLAKALKDALTSPFPLPAATLGFVIKGSENKKDKGMGE